MSRNSMKSVKACVKINKFKNHYVRHRNNAYTLWIDCAPDDTYAVTVDCNWFVEWPEDKSIIHSIYWRCTIHPYVQLSVILMYGYRLAPTQYRFWFLVIQQYAISINDDWAQRLRVNKIRILFFRGISHFAMHEYFFRDHEYISSIFHVKLGRCRVLPNPFVRLRQTFRSYLYFCGWYWDMLPEQWPSIIIIIIIVALLMSL